MSMPASNQDETSKMKKIMNASVDESIWARLPKVNGAKPPQILTSVPTQPMIAIPVPVPPVEKEPAVTRSRLKFLPAFWTIASFLSLTVNVVLIIILLIVFQMRNGIQGVASDQISGLLGGLYTNFVKMDQASIQTNIHVEKQIPVQFSLNVSGPTNVTLSQPVRIDGALVTVATGGLNIVNARATIVLPQGTLLPINIENLVVPVDQQVLADLDVPVNIPLNQTQLHEPFVGLQKVVEPWYCLVQPNALMNGLQVCSPKANP
jgi:hypothetical protein